MKAATISLAVRRTVPFEHSTLSSDYNLKTARGTEHEAGRFDQTFADVC